MYMIVMFNFKILKYDVNIFKYYIAKTTTTIFVNWPPIKAVHHKLKLFTIEI